MIWAIVLTFFFRDVGAQESSSAPAIALNTSTTKIIKQKASKKSVKKKSVKKPVSKTKENNPQTPPPVKPKEPAAQMALSPLQEKEQEEGWWESLKIVDQTQRFISNQWIGLNYNLDTFFSNEIYAKKQNRSLILAYYGVTKKESADPLYVFDIRAKVHLPRTTNRMRIVIEKERDEILQTVSNEPGSVRSTTTAGNATGTVSKSNYIAGLTYLLSDTRYYQTFLDTGMRIILPLDPYIKFRLQKGVETKWINIFASQGVFLFRQDGLQEVTQLSFYRKLSKMFQLELINSLSWTDKEDTFIERNNLILYQQLDDRRSLSYSVGANARLSPTFYYNSYDTAINYRQLLHGNWLFGFLSVGAEYYKDHDFRMEKFIQGRIEVFFR